MEIHFYLYVVALFQGKNEVNQYEQICDLIGCPNQKVWAEFFDLPMSKKLLEKSQNKYNNIPQMFSKFSPNCVDLLNSFMTWDPKKRISVNLRVKQASQALLHDFFTEYPYPKQPNEISCLKIIN